MKEDFAISQAPTYHKYKKSRFWVVRDENGDLLTVTVYKKGAKAVVSRLKGEYGYSLTEAGTQALAEANEARRK